MISEFKTKLIITRKNLSQLYEILDKQMNNDVEKYDLNTLPGAIKTDTLGVISINIRNIEYELKQIEDAVSLSEDMDRNLVNTK